MTGPSGVRWRLAHIVANATDHAVTPAEALAAPSWALLGITSLATLRIIDAVEREFDVSLDLTAQPELVTSVDLLAAHLERAAADHG